MKNKGILYVLLSAICFSIAGVLIKSIPWSSMAISGSRCILAMAVMLLYMRYRHHKLRWNRAVLIGTICNFIMSTSFVFATKMTTAANAIVLQFTEPVFVIFAVWIFFGEKPKKDSLITAGIVFLGILCFFIGKLSPSGMAGNLLAILSGIAYTGVFLIKKLPDGDFESSMIFSYLLTLLLSIPSLLEIADFRTPVLVSVLVLGIVQYGFSYIFLSNGLDYVSPVTASLTSTVEPILNPLIVAVVMGEKVGVFAVIGSVLVLGASTVYNLKMAREKTLPEQQPRQCR